MLKNIFNYYKDCLQVKGRLGRLEYLKRIASVLIPLVISYLIIVVGGYLLLSGIGSIALNILGVVLIAGCVAFSIFGIIANITLNIRRLHDVNLSGWWVLWIMIASMLFSILLGAISGIFSMIVFFSYFLIPGTSGKNDFDIESVAETKQDLDVAIKAPQEEIKAEKPAEKPVKKKTTTKKKPVSKTTKKVAAKKTVAKKKVAPKTKPKKTAAKKKTTNKAKGTK